MSFAKALRAKSIQCIGGGGEVSRRDDWVAVEEPLELRVNGRSIALVMRTPGDDRELAAGFLLSEGIVRGRDDIFDLVRCPEGGSRRRPVRRKSPVSPDRGNILDVHLAPSARVDLARLTRHVFTSSSCGICSRASIEAVCGEFPRLEDSFRASARVIARLPAALSAAQAGFAATGGLHASALFDAAGQLELLREDVGRHNAVDKVIGHAFLGERLPLRDRILLVSGRVSFEIMQKALAGGISCVAAISAPTTAAVEFAAASGQTLVGFLRPEKRGRKAMRMNVYAGTLSG